MNVPPENRRTDPGPVGPAIFELGVAVPASFREFYEMYEGSFGNERTGFELMDLCEPSPSIVTMTQECREIHGWPPQFLVLSDDVGNAVLVLDASRDLVFNVDFEGGDEMLVQGTLEPQWPSFAAFLEDYFGAPE